MCGNSFIVVVSSLKDSIFNFLPVGSLLLILHILAGIQARAILFIHWDVLNLW